MARLPLALQLWISAVCLLLVCFYFYLPGVATQDFQKGVVHMGDAPVGDFAAVEKKGGICDKFVDSFTSVVQEKCQVVFRIGSCVALYIAVRISFLGAKGGYISHGTTNMALIFREHIILGVDSKVTLIHAGASEHVERHEDRIENCKKWHSILRPNGHAICATAAGYQYSCNQTWKHMEEYVQTHPHASIGEIAKYAEDIPRSWKGYAGNYIAAMFVAGFDDDGTPQVYVHQDSLEAKDSFRIPEDCCAIGSGSEAAIQGWEKTLEYISKQRKEKIEEPSSLEEALKMVEISLLFASLKDYHTGGILTVLRMSPNETEIRPACTMPVARLYHKHYSCFKYLEKQSVFAFYKPNMMTEDEFAEVMRCAGGRIRP